MNTETISRALRSHLVPIACCVVAWPQAATAQVGNAAQPLRPLAASQAQPVAPLRFGATGATRFEDFAALPDGTVVEGPGGKRTTAGDIKRARQLKLAHRSAAQRTPPPAAPRAPEPSADTKGGGTRRTVLPFKPAQPSGPTITSAIGCEQQGIPAFRLEHDNCNSMVIIASGFGNAPSATLVGAFPGGSLPLVINVHGSSDEISLRVPQDKSTGFAAQCNAAYKDRAPTPNARLVLRTQAGQETSMEVCVLPRFAVVPVAPVAATNLHSSGPPPSVTTQAGMLIVRRSAELEQPFAQDWGAQAPPLNCFPPGQDTVDLPALPAGSQFRWQVQQTGGRQDIGPNDANGGSGQRAFKGQYQISAEGTPRTVSWGVWESLHNAAPPEGDDKVCLSMYALSFYLEGPAGVAPPSF